MSDLKDGYNQGDALTWVQVHNFIPIITAIVTAIVAYYYVHGQIELQAQRQAFQETHLQAISSDLRELERKYEQVLVTSGTATVKGVSSISGTLRPTKTSTPSATRTPTKTPTTTPKISPTKAL